MYQVLVGNCLKVLPTLPAEHFDAVVCDPPYPMIKRPYGMMTEDEWLAFMKHLVLEVRRVLKPTGSAIFIIQPNSARVGQLRLWHLRFQLWAAEYWGIVQDSYWINTCALPVCGADRKNRLMRPATKLCVWLGDPDCYRDQDSVLWTPSKWSNLDKLAERCRPSTRPSGLHVYDLTMGNAAIERGGVTPSNFIACGNAHNSGGHPAATPLDVCTYWVKYLCPPGGTVLDPCAGSGTVGLACLQNGRNFVGIERDSGYAALAEVRLAREAGPELVGEQQMAA